MIEKNLKICNKFINKLVIKIEDLNSNIILLLKINKKIFKNIINQKGGSNLIESININDSFINKIFIKIKDLKNNFTLLSKVNKIILKNIIKQQGGAIDMYNINYAFLNLTKQKILLNEYNKNIKKLNERFRPMYKILTKTYSHIVVFFETLTNILGYTNKNINTYTHTDTFKQIIKDDLPELENLIYELIEKNKLSIDKHQKLIQIIGDDKLLEFLPIKEDTIPEHTIRESIEPIPFPSLLKEKAILDETKQRESEERMRRMQQTIEQAKAAAKQEKAKAEAEQEHRKAQQILRAKTEQEAELRRQEEVRRLEELKRQTEQQVRREITSQKPELPELSQESIREIREEGLKKNLTDKQLDDVIKKVLNESKKIHETFDLLYHNRLNIILVKTPPEPDYDPSEYEINNAYKILEDSFKIYNYYKTDSEFLHNFFASINYVIYDKYYNNKDTISSRKQFLLTMKEIPLINIITTIFDNMHTGFRDKYIALKQAYIKYKNYSDKNNSRFRTSTERTEANIKALEYITYKQNIININMKMKEDDELTREQTSIIRYLAYNKINILNKYSQTPDSDKKLTQKINQLDFVDNILFLRRGYIRDLIILLVFNTICSFKIKKEDLVNVIKDNTYIDEILLPTDVKREIDKDKNKADRYWIYWINCVIYNMSCSWTSGCIYKPLPT